MNYYSDPAKLYTEALCYLRNDEVASYHKRVIVMLKALVREPRDEQKIIMLFNWLNDLAHKYNHKKEHTKALRILNIMLKLCPTNPITHNNLGVVYLELGKLGLAEKVALKAYQLAPQNDKYLDFLFLIKSMQGKYSEILNESIELINKHPIKALYRTWYGYALQRLNRNEEAIEALKCSIALDNKDTTARVILAESYKKSGQLTEAIEVCKEAHKVNPQETGIIEMLGCAYGQMNDYKSAEQTFAKALKQDPYSDYAAKGLLLALKKQGKLSQELYDNYKANINTFCQLYSLDETQKGGQ